MLTIIWQFLNIRKNLFLRRFANLHLPFCPFFHVINKFASFVYKKKAMLSEISWWHCLLRHIFICYFQLLSVCTSDNLNPSVFQQLANLSDSTAFMSFYLCNRKDGISKKRYFLRKLLLSFWQAGFLTHRLSDVSPEVFRISQVCRFAFSHICAMTVLKLRLHTVAATVQAFYLISSHKTPTLCAELIHLLVIQLRDSNCNTGCF